MRLFIALNFNDIIKEKLVEVQNRLKEYSICGSFTAYENLHLTIVFLGETAGNRISALTETINCVKFEPFDLSFSGIGSFTNGGEELLWIGIDANKNLSKIYEELVTRLDSIGFMVEKRRFTPHLTLARRAKMNGDFNPALFSRETAAICTEVSKISLMKSDQMNGRHVYSEIGQGDGSSDLPNQ